MTLTGETLVAQSTWSPRVPCAPAAIRRACACATGRTEMVSMPCAHSSSRRPRSIVERLAGTPAPTGWSSGRERRTTITEEEMIGHADFCAAHFDRRFLRLIELGEGYQRSAGDWETERALPPRPPLAH